MVAMGQLDPSAVIPGFVTPPPQNVFGFPGALPGIPGVPGLLDPGGQTDPNKPRVDPLPGGGGTGPAPPQQAPSGSPVATVAIAVVAALAIGFIVARVTA